MKFVGILLVVVASALAENWKPYKGKYLVQQSLNQTKAVKFDQILYRNSDSVAHIVDKAALSIVKIRNPNVKIYHLESLIKDESDKLSKRKIFAAGDDPSIIDLETYHNLTEIQAFINAAAKSIIHRQASLILENHSKNGIFLELKLAIQRMERKQF